MDDLPSKSCFFIGHRNAPELLAPLLDDAIERHITEYGVKKFFVGHYGRFDYLAAGAVRRAKKQHPDVTLVLLLPYYPYKYWKEVSEDYDYSYYPPDMEKVPRPYGIVRANEYMIRNSEYLICYNIGLVGKTRDFVDLALRRQARGELGVKNLADALKKTPHREVHLENRGDTEIRQ